MVWSSQLVPLIKKLVQELPDGSRRLISEYLFVTKTDPYDASMSVFMLDFRKKRIDKRLSFSLVKDQATSLVKLASPISISGLRSPSNNMIDR